eukprot:COSAG04_NODE_19514_length_414_cov_1.047619_2_plen_37_part_01
MLCATVCARAERTVDESRIGRAGRAIDETSWGRPAPP